MKRPLLVVLLTCVLVGAWAAASPAAISIIKGPYLQNVTTDSIVVMWQTDVVADSRVDFGPTAAYTDHVSDPTLAQIHEVHLAGLSLDTLYHYRVASTAGVETVYSADNTLRTAVAAGTPFRFGAYGDSRSGTTIHTAVIQAMLSHAPRIVLHTGDIVGDGTIEDRWPTEYFTPASPLIKNTPMFLTLGNHEKNSILYYNYFDPPDGGGDFNERWYSFNYGSAHFISLDTNADYAPGSAQYNWLVSDLEAANAEWLFVMHHHPPYSSKSGGGNVYVQAYLVPLYEAYDVDIVFNGHDHFYERSYKDGVTYIITGGGGASLYDPNVTPNPYQVYAEKVNHHCTVDISGLTATVKAYRNDGSILDSVTLTHTVHPPVADFTGTPTSGPAPLTVSFTDTSTGTPTSWSWSFGDGGSSALRNPSHQYTSAGSYTVSLTATNAGGSNTRTKTNYITVTVAPPVADFTATPTSGRVPLTVTFTDTSTGSPTSWSWDFGDGGASTERNPSHQYTSVGTYTVSLTATNAAGANTKTKADYIVVASPPVADFTATPSTGVAPLLVWFTDRSTGNPTSWIWDLGNGATSTLQNPRYEYRSAGNYTVTLTATNAGGSSTKTKTNFITVVASGILSGTVKDRVTNAPIVGATIQAYLGGTLKGTATSNAEGIYRIERGLPAGTYAVKCAKTGYVTQTKDGIAVSPGAVSYASFFLVRSGILSGTIKDRMTNAPIGEATITAYLGDSVKGTATSNVDGGYRIAAGLAEGVYKVVVSKNGYVTQTKDGIAVSPGAVSYASFFLVPSGILSGTVRDRVSGEPINHAFVHAFLAGVRRGTAMTNADGGYRIATDLPAGSYAVKVSAGWGYIEQTKDGIPVAPGTTTYASFFVVRSGVLTGTTKDKVTNGSISGATISAYLGGVIQGTAISGPYGSYSFLDGLPEGTYTVTAAKTGYVTEAKDGVAIVWGEYTDVIFLLVPTGTLTGTVKDRVTNAAIAGATIRVYLGSVLTTTATSAANGVYRITDTLPAGNYVVTATKAGYVTQSKSAAVTVGATAYASFFLVPAGTLAGTVKDRGTNLPITGAAVKVYLSGALKATATTDASGNYRIVDTLPAATYVVTCAKTGYITLSKTAVVTAGSTVYASFFLTPTP